VSITTALLNFQNQKILELQLQKILELQNVDVEDNAPEVDEEPEESPGILRIYCPRTAKIRKSSIDDAPLKRRTLLGARVKG